MTSDERVIAMIKNPPTFILGITLAFALGEKWIKRNFTENFMFQDIKNKTTRIDLQMKYHSTTFTTKTSDIIIATAGSIICWAYKTDMYDLYGGTSRKVIYLSEN